MSLFLAEGSECLGCCPRVYSRDKYMFFRICIVTLILFGDRCAYVCLAKNDAISNDTYAKHLCILSLVQTVCAYTARYVSLSLHVENTWGDLQMRWMRYFYPCENPTRSVFPADGISLESGTFTAKKHVSTTLHTCRWWFARQCTTQGSVHQRSVRWLLCATKESQTVSVKWQCAMSFSFQNILLLVLVCTLPF